MQPLGSSLETHTIDKGSKGLLWVKVGYPQSTVQSPCWRRQFSPPRSSQDRTGPGAMDVRGIAEALDDSAKSCPLVGGSRGKVALNFRDMSDVWTDTIQEGRVYRCSQFYRWKTMAGSCSAVVFAVHCVCDLPACVWCGSGCIGSWSRKGKCPQLIGTKQKVSSTSEPSTILCRTLWELKMERILGSTWEPDRVDRVPDPANPKHVGLRLLPVLDTIVFAHN